MTTRVMERGRVKCGQYWESEVDGVAEYDNFRVRTMHIESNDDYTVVSLELTNIKVIICSHYLFKKNKPNSNHVLFMVLRLTKQEKYHIGNLHDGQIMVYQHQQ